jgi:salicylate hydroxylase/6-hydroxynicotinate 3-monooxygenase
MDRKKKLSLAIVGAGMGGLAAAATLRHFGMNVEVYEQARRFARIGAGIQMMPNSMKVLRAIGIEQRLRGRPSPALAPQPGLGYRRGHARAAHAGEPLRGAVSVHASRRSPRCAPVVLPEEIVHLDKKLVASSRPAAASPWRSPTAAARMPMPCRGRRGHSAVRDIIVARTRPSTKAASPTAPSFRQP